MITLGYPVNKDKYGKASAKLLDVVPRSPQNKPTWRQAQLEELAPALADLGIL